MTGMEMSRRAAERGLTGTTARAKLAPLGRLRAPGAAAAYDGRNSGALGEGDMDVLKEIIQFLGGAALLLGAVAWMIKALIDALFKRDLKTLEIRMKSSANRELELLKAEMQKSAGAELETLKDRLQRGREQDTRSSEATQARAAWIRGEIHRWANPILGAVRDLESRLRNILKRGAYPALQRNPVAPHSIPQNWSISYDYFMPSTLFLFAQYFYWVRRLQEELGFELFESQADKDAFVGELWKVSDALGRWPLLQDQPCTARDAQVFNLQQRGIGEAVRVRGDVSRCMGFDEFMDAWEDPPLSDQLAPLRLLLEDLVADGSCRWKRMEGVLAAVQGLEEHCRKLLQLPHRAATAGATAAVATP
jgi:hypothetical protein